MTGASDILNVAETLPKELDDKLEDTVEIHWVRGPISQSTKKTKLRWDVYNASEQLDELIVQSNYVLTVFGVPFFEVRQYGVPTVAFSHYDDKDDFDLKVLSKEDVAKIETDSKKRIEKNVK